MDFAADFELDDLPSFGAAESSQGLIMEESKPKAVKEEFYQGVYKDMPNETYHASSAISKSGLDRLAQSPAHLFYYQMDGSRSSPALKTGSLFHDVTLMGVEWSKRIYKIIPPFNARSNAGKEEYQHWLSMLASFQLPVSQEDWDLAMAMRDSVMMHPYAKWVIEQSQAVNSCENSHFWNDDDTFNYCRVRPDIKLSSQGILADLKSTADCTPLAFAKSIAEYRYDVQDAMYRDGVNKTEGVEITDFWFIAVEKKLEKPVTAIYRLDEAARNRGYEFYRRDMNKYAELMAMDDYVAPTEITMPHWAFK